MSKYEVRIPDSVINIIHEEENQRKPTIGVSEQYITEMPHVQSSFPETSFGYLGQPDSVSPLFTGASYNYFYGAQRMEIFGAMNQRQFAGYPIPSIQYPDYLARMPTEFPVTSQFDELTGSSVVNVAESSCLQQGCATPQHATQSCKTFETEEQSVMSRRPNCARCRNHDFKVAVKGHKKHCPFKDCECDKCVLIKERQVLMKKQHRIKRQYYQKVDPEPSHLRAPLSVETSQNAPQSVSAYGATETHLPPIKRRKIYNANSSIEMSTRASDQSRDLARL